LQTGERPDSLLAGLNAAQREAVTTTEGPLLVLAGAGTGKTRVITHRIAYLLRMGVPTEAVAAVTFTNKAAREMRERVKALAGRGAKGVTLSTFHSLGVRLLREEAAALGYRPGFNIYDTADQLSLVKTILLEVRGATTSPDPKAVLATISKAKNRFQMPDDLIEEATDDWEHLVARCYSRYQSDLRNMNCVDFDDLLLLPVLCLEKHAEIAAKYRRKYRYLLVDEYQDTNGVQYRFLRLLIGPERNLCVVGDDDQSIYGFRGAEVDKILRFERDFPGTRVVKLEDNYRSTASILNLANAVIEGNVARHKKCLRSTLGQGEAVRWITTPDGEAEVDHVIRQVLNLIETERVPSTSIAILIRAGAQARPFEEKLRLRKIPYTLVGGQSYFDRKEIRDVLAYWMVAANPRDDLSFMRIINVPRRGIGTATARKLNDLAQESKISLLEAASRASASPGGVSPALRKALGHVADLFDRARRLLETRQFSRAARQLLEEACYREAVDELYHEPTTRLARWNAVEDLVRAVTDWERENPGAEFADFLEALALTKGDATDGASTEKKRQGLTILTLHSAKGLEFPHVFLVGVEEETLPHRRSVEEGDAAVEEERRLLYVGVTRARETLTVTQAQSRVLYGQPRPRLPSRFLLEVEETGYLQRGAYDPREEATENDVQDFLQLYRRMREPS
jgi:DNA helicase-2/ATP-dependent DNA helicase PcrA